MVLRSLLEQQQAGQMNPMGPGEAAMPGMVPPHGADMAAQVAPDDLMARLLAAREQMPPEMMAPQGMGAPMGGTAGDPMGGGGAPMMPQADLVGRLAALRGR